MFFQNPIINQALFFPMMNKPLPIVVLISGFGSNLQALIDSQSDYAFEIKGVISNNPNAFGLTRAQNANIPCQVVSHLAFESQSQFEASLIETIKHYQTELIVLAGFMRILSPAFIDAFSYPIINIHPSLLPKYKGLNTHAQVLAANESEHGVSVHFVTQELDGGPIITQVKIPVNPQENLETLKNRIHQVEHWLYPRVVGWYGQKRVKCSPAMTFDVEDTYKGS